MHNHSGNQRHPYHLVTPSPWPFAVAIPAFLIPIGAVQYMHGFSGGLFFLLFGLFSTLLIMGVWWSDIIKEATFEGMHTSVVQRGLKLGFILFIASEVMFFSAFFWAFFHSSLAPTIEIGSIWPPAGIVTFNPWGIPLYNTYILLLSGATITAVHHAILTNDNFETKSNFLKTIFLAIAFTGFQVFEYLESPFSISDGVYGSTFFMATGFHGAHVLIGTIFISVCFVRFIFHHFTSTHHIGFEAAAWYWHFVDVVWLFLFVTVYWWGSILLLILYKLKMRAFFPHFQIGFQESASPVMDGLIDLHNYIFFYLILIFVFVFTMFIFILKEFFFRQNNVTHLWDLIDRSSLVKSSSIAHGTALEIVWTTIPSIILAAIGVPSFVLLYAMDEIIDPELTVKIIGHQWFWSYDLTSISISIPEKDETIWTKCAWDEKTFQDFTNAEDLMVFDSYMLPENALELGDFRLLEVDSALILPIETHIKILVTAGDVLHSWAVPALGLKIDAVPGRLNQTSVFIKHEGVFYGQCSEICGVGHGFMPIQVYAISSEDYEVILDQLCLLEDTKKIIPSIFELIETEPQEPQEPQELQNVQESVVETDSKENLS